jgi:hypothetical protein
VSAGIKYLGRCFLATIAFFVIVFIAVSIAQWLRFDRVEFRVLGSGVDRPLSGSE